MRSLPLLAGLAACFPSSDLDEYSSDLGAGEDLARPDAVRADDAVVAPSPPAGGNESPNDAASLEPGVPGGEAVPDAVERAGEAASSDEASDESLALEGDAPQPSGGATDPEAPAVDEDVTAPPDAEGDPDALPPEEPTPEEPTPEADGNDGGGGRRRGRRGGDGPDPAPGEPTTPEAPVCEVGVPGPDDTCYEASSVARNWYEAQADCAQRGGALARIDSFEEDAFVGDLLDENIWLGASDVTLDGAFAWTDGQPVTFDGWGPQQPDDFVGPDCVEKRQEPGEPWFDQPCGDPHLYVCEWPALTGP